MRCVIWYHLYNLKNWNNTHVRVSGLQNCAYGTRSPKASQGFARYLLNLEDNYGQCQQ